MTEYWLISAPGETTCQKTWEKLNAATSAQNLSINNKFHIPNLKVGTLDTLVGLSDDLGKLDAYSESITRKVAQYLGEVMEGQKDKLQENLLASGMELPTYLMRFQWDMAKYPIQQSLRNIADIINKQLAQIDADLKTKAASYNNLKNNLAAMERKSTGSLLTRNLADIVTKEDFVLESDYLITILVVIPRNMVTDWEQRYETLTSMIVPRSSRKLIEDNEHALYTVTLFRKALDEFKHHCRENKFIVRDFQYSEEDIRASRNEVNKMAADKKKQYGPLVRWLKVNFSEAFTAWIHVKALRVFVESVLRYGLPVNFQAMLLLPNKKSVKKLKETLNDLYQHLDSSPAAPAVSGEVFDIPGLNVSQADYHPYVSYKISIDMLDVSGKF